MVIGKELRSSFVLRGESSTGSRAVAIQSPFAQAFGSSHVVELHIQQLQLLAANQFGARMPALRTWAFRTGSLEVMAAVLAAVTQGQDLHWKLGASGRFPAGDISKDT